MICMYYSMMHVLFDEIFDWKMHSINRNVNPFDEKLINQNINELAKTIQPVVININFASR